MEHVTNPAKRRRVGSRDNNRRVQISLRLSREAGRLVELMCQTGTLDEEGCTKGDVLEIAIREQAESLGVPCKE